MAIRIQTTHLYLLLVLAIVAPFSFASQDILLAGDGKQEDFFAYSVAIDGNTALVGAYTADIGNVTNAGAAYVYVLTENGWMQQAKLMAADGDKTDIFGVRVSISGNTALISARRDDVHGIGVGAGSVVE